MSTPTPDAVPTSTDRTSQRPTKRRALSPASQRRTELEALFANADREIIIPTAATNGLEPLPPPPEIVNNVQGSSAGAGSGEFHVYKASRRREFERLKRMDEEVAEEAAAKEYNAKMAELKKRDAEKTNKNRARREKKKNKGKGGTNGSSMEGITKSVHLAAPEKPKEEGEDTSSKSIPVVEEIGVIIHDD